MSKAKEAIRHAIAAGYRVDMQTGDVYGKAGQKLTGTIAANGYVYVGLFIKGVTPARRGLQVAKHQLIAYVKYGELAFQKGIETRHFDGNRLNNIPSNILIGTRSENMMDMSPEARRARNLNRVSKKRVLSEEAVKHIREVYDRGLSRGECARLAKLYGVNPTTISEVGNRKAYNARS